MKIYTPVVRAANNDLKAIELLSDRARSSVMPLVEAPQSISNGYLRTNVAKATDLLLGRMEGTPYYFDPLGIESFERHIISFESLAEANRKFTPVIGLGRGALDYLALAKLINNHALDLAIRLDKEDMDDASEDTWAKVISISGSVGVGANQITLLVDFRQLGELPGGVIIDSVLDFLALQPSNLSNAKIVILGSSALSTVTSVPTDGRVDIPRRELQLWGALQFELGGSRNSIGFGDYGVIDPSFIFPGGPIINANAKVRYTYGANTAYFRGHGLYNPNRFPQFHDLAKRVIESGVYMGAAFSHGDGVIKDCAEHRCGPGNAGTWVMVGTNHHVEYTAGQVVKLNSLLNSARSPSEVQAIIAES